MSYTRGTYYIWSDERYTHLNDAKIPIDVIDEFVAMRWAELVKSGEAIDAKRRAMSNWRGNVGAGDLLEAEGREQEWIPALQAYDKSRQKE